MGKREPPFLDAAAGEREGDALEEEDALEAEDGVSPPELEGDLPADRRGDEDRGP